MGFRDNTGNYLVARVFILIMTVTVSDIQLAFDEMMENHPFERMMYEYENEARKLYSNQVAYLDDCGESAIICNKCSNRFECLKRII